MTTPAEILTADIRSILASLAATTGIRAGDIVRGSGRAEGHVSARHAAFWLLRERGHTITAIAGAFGQTRTGVQSILKRITMHGRVRDMADKARFGRPLANSENNCLHGAQG